VARLMHPSIISVPEQGREGDLRRGRRARRHPSAATDPV
jgi:hypothetical protein